MDKHVPALTILGMNLLDRVQLNCQSFPDLLVVCAKVAQSAETPFEVAHHPVLHRHDVLAITKLSVFKSDVALA